MHLKFSPEEEAFREEIRGIFAKVPEDIRERNEAGKLNYPDDLVTTTRILNEHGVAVPGWPVEWGGKNWTPIESHIYREEMALMHVPDLLPFNAGMIGPVIAQFGSQEMKERFLPKTANLDIWWCQGFSEPEAGSDLASLKTRAVRDGDHYVVNGAKTYITSAVRADFVVTAVRTGGPGAGGVSLLVIDKDTPGFTVTRRLEKMGWRSSDTAELSFVDARVPVTNLVGAQNSGFAQIAAAFVTERSGLAVQAYASAQRCLDLTLAWVRDRQTFGKPLIARQSVQDSLTEMARRIDIARTYTRAVIERKVTSGDDLIAEVCFAKNTAVETGEWVADKAVQLFGGLGYMTGTEVERQYRDMRIIGIGGGTTEILSGLAAKRLGYQQ